MSQPIPYVIDFDGLTMDTTQANDKLVPPAMLEVKNIEVSRRGRARKTYGYDNVSTNVAPNVNEVSSTVTRINAIVPTFIGQTNIAAGANLIAIGDGQFYWLNTESTAWAATTAVTPGDVSPWNIAWGINTSGAGGAAVNTPQVYFARDNKGVFGVEGVGGNAVKYGYTSDNNNEWDLGGAVEFFLDKLFVGNIRLQSSSAQVYDRIYWSVTGDDNNFYGAGSGFLDLRAPGGGRSSIGNMITGMRVYQNRLWIATTTSLYVLTGKTSATFGIERVYDTGFVNGSTLYVAGSYLWWVDNFGIWQFNGRVAQNVSSKGMFEEWSQLSYTGDVAPATATWNDLHGIYSVYFPAKQEQWNYHYETGQWDIRTFSGSDVIRTISPPINTLAGICTNYALGGLTKGRVFNVNDQAITDDTATITGSVTTGNIRLGEINGRVGDHARLLYMDIETVQQDQAGIVKVDITIDGVIQYEFKSPGGTGLVAQAIDGSEIVISVDGSHGLTAPFVMKVDSEQMHCTSVSTNDFTVTRGYNRTTAVTHDNDTAYTYDVETGSLTIGDAGSSAYTSPTHYDGKPTSRIDLGNITKSGRFFQFRFWDDDANSRMDLRRVTIWYERLENAGSRPS